MNLACILLALLLYTYIYICPQGKVKVFLTLKGIRSNIDRQLAFFHLKCFRAKSMHMTRDLHTTS